MATGEEFKYRLTFESTATGTGAEETLEALRSVEKSTGELGTQQKRSAAEFANTTDKARVQQFAFYDLDAEMRRTGKTTETLTGGVTQIGKSSGNAARSLYVFSQGFEDLQYGIRGVLNNIPQLVLAMGGTVGLAGVISIVAVGMNALYRILGNTEEKVSNVTDRVTEMTDAFQGVETDRFEKVADSIDAAKDAAEALSQRYDATREAEAKFASATLTNAEKIAMAEKNIAIALGEQVDSYTELEAIAARAEAQRQLAAQQAIDAENQKLTKARETVTSAADYLAAKEQQASIEQGNLIQLKAQLEVLQAQEKELKKIAAERVSLAEALAQGGVFPGQKTAAADQAQKKLDDPKFLGTLEITRNRVTELETAVKALVDENKGAVVRAQNALNAAQAQAKDLEAGVTLNIQRIEESLAVDNLLARSQTAVQKGEQVAKDLQSLSEGIASSNQRVIEAKQVIDTVTADGRITVEELRPAAEAQRAIVGGIQAGVASINLNQQQFLILVQGLQRDQAELARQLQILRETTPPR